MSRNLKEILRKRLKTHKDLLDRYPLLLNIEGRVDELEYVIKLLDDLPVVDVKELDKYSAWDLIVGESL